MPDTTPHSPAAETPYVLVCERVWLYHTLTFVAGFWGSFTYLLRGSVFCNAQTGNVVLMGMALGAGQWRHALYYLIPISAYIAGAFFSELLPNPVKHHLPIRWETLLVGIEIAGYPTLVALILLLGGIQLLALGIIGEYLARNYVETKRRPVYIVRDVIESEAERRP